MVGRLQSLTCSIIGCLDALAQELAQRFVNFDGPGGLCWS
jgi:hypothetical protein